MTLEHPPRRSGESEIITISARRFIMCAMNEESLPPFAALALRSFPGACKRALRGLFKRRRKAVADSAADPALRSRAASAIREYAETHATLFERAERLK